MGVKKEGRVINLNIKKVKLEQARACLSVAELAQKAELGSGTLQKILSKQRIAAPKTIGKIARALNVPIEDLVTFDEEDT